jgi:hypothetical protein
MALVTPILGDRPRLEPGYYDYFTEAQTHPNIRHDAPLYTTQDDCVSEMPWRPRDASIPAAMDDDIAYALPFIFPFFGRDIVKINVNTNGLIELLEEGETCLECTDPLTHLHGDHAGWDLDTIFAANDDLITTVLIEGHSDRVEIIWAEFDGDLFSGIYDGEGEVEFAVPGGTPGPGEGIERAYEFDPIAEEIQEIGWDANDESIPVRPDGAPDSYLEYTLPFIFPYEGRSIETISVNTHGLVELLENGEPCIECDAGLTHFTNNHVLHDIDALFAANDLHFGGVIFEGSLDHVEVTGR